MTTAKPVVATQTTSSSESVLTVMHAFNKGRIIIPSYQRDSEQWDLIKQSIFIESLLNNLTVPALFLAPTQRNDEEFDELVDGQQRISTILSYAKGELKLASSEDAPYLNENSVYYAEKYIESLPERFRGIFEDYKLTMIRLPYNLPESIRLEIFRRINEGGMPLSGQDLRLAYYQCGIIDYIRLAGIYDPERSGAKRMLAHANKEYGLQWPWKTMDDSTQKEWREWWQGKKITVGQTASEMFLWYLIARYHTRIDTLLGDKNYLASQLHTTFSNRVEEVADIVCSQLRLDEEQYETHPKLCNLETLQNQIFPEFAQNFHSLRIHIPSCATSVDKYRRIAIILAGLSGWSLDAFNDRQWSYLTQFLKKPRQLTTQNDIEFPETKGRWTGPKGQFSQIASYYKVAQMIARDEL
ncbi:MAG: DUF262 domain-containing protein [SAR324 cluster bacterium]|nr:DUF262 domain-containing protein [SAR324 cluster bacterium]